jgi:hypothetical protein
MTVRPLTLSVLTTSLLIAMPEIVLANGARQVATNVGENVANLPRVVAVIAYVLGTFFAVSGLLKLKDWLNEGDKAGINPALFRLVTAGLLIAFPHTMRVVAGTWFGRADGKTSVNVDVPRPKLNAFERNKQ